MAKLNTVEGIVAFSNLTQHDVFRGKSTGKYTLTITLDDDNANELERLGVDTKTYKEKAQRQFKTQYNIPVIDADDNVVIDMAKNGQEDQVQDLHWGTKVRVAFEVRPTQGGMTPYLKGVRVLELPDLEEYDIASSF